MGKLRYRLPGHGTIAAYLALFVALSTGGAYAANEIGSKDIAKKAVKSMHIKNTGVKGKDIAADAIDSSKVGDGSLHAQDFGDGELPQGPQGDTGPQGPAGATNVQIRFSNSPSGCTAEGCHVTDHVVCLQGERAVGGGGTASANDDLYLSRPLSNGWTAGANDELGEDASASVKAYVVCASP